MVLREWLKYRYGVFEELRGFPGDQVMMMIVIVMMMMIAGDRGQPPPGPG